MPSTIPTVTLANGIEMPTVGYGVYLIPPTETERAVSDALEAGYRSIDTASGYQNEEAVGRAIAASGIPATSYSSPPSSGSRTPAKAKPRSPTNGRSASSASTTSTST
jgi:hypothetical protein